MCKYIKIISITAVILILLPFISLTASATEITVNEKNDIIELMRNECLFKQDKLMIPFRMFWETFGATVDWDNEQKTATAFYESDDLYEFEINVFMGEKPQIKEIWGNNKADMTVIVDNEVYPVFFNIPAEIIDNRLYISSDVLTETFGAVVIYDWYKIFIKFTADNILNMAQRETERAEIIRLINETRIENGLTPLKQVTLLNEISRIRAQDKADFKYFGHTSPRLGAPAEMLEKHTNILRFTGECMYYCSIKVPPERVFNAWLDSPGHRAVILYENTKYIGINMFTDDKGGVYWALLTAREK